MKDIFTKLKNSLKKAEKKEQTKNDKLIAEWEASTIKCTNCKFMIQGSGSVVCCHPEGKMKYIYPYLEDKCNCGGFIEMDKSLSQSERYKKTAEEVNWQLQTKGLISPHYAPIKLLKK